MLVAVTLFTILPAFLIVAAPLPAYHSTSVANTADVTSRSILYRRAPPKYNIPHRFVTPTQRKDTIDRMKTHYETEATEGQKWARYASVASRWNKVSPNSAREYLTFNYHEGENENTPILFPHAKIYRDKPVPKLIGHMKMENRNEITKEGVKRYNTLSPADADRVKSMRVMDDWGPNGGILDKTTLTFHSASKPNDGNILGGPMTMYRPLTVKLPDVSLLDKMTIDYNVREAHKKIAADPQHPAATSNYAIVSSGWQDSETRRIPRKLVMKLEEVSEDEQRKKHLGYYSVQKNTAEYEQVGTPPPHAETSHAGPSNEVPHPSGSQYQQHSYAGSPSAYTLPLNSGSSHPNTDSQRSLPFPNSGLSHLNNQEGLQFTAGNPTSHPESLHPTSSQQPLQLHTVSPPPNGQTLHLNNLPSHSGPPLPGSAQPDIAALPSHHLGPSSNPGRLPHPNHLDYGLSPEIWNILNTDSVHPYPWDPHHSP